jgi:hypothetical protein
VKGWDGGITWINTSTLAKRYEYASWIISGTQGMQKLAGMDLGRLAIESGLLEVPAPMLLDPAMSDPAPMNGKSDKELRKEAAKKARAMLAISPIPIDNLVKPEDRMDQKKIISLLANRLLCGFTLPKSTQNRLLESFGASTPLTDDSIRNLILGLLQSPAYQVT